MGIRKVSSMTNTCVAIGGSNLFWKKNGRLRGGDVWYSRHLYLPESEQEIQEIQEEERKRVRLHNVRVIANKIIHTELSPEVVEDIHESFVNIGLLPDTSEKTKS